MSKEEQKLTVPLEGGKLAVIPFPMTEADFELLVDTLMLWKSKMTVSKAKD